MKTIGHNCIYFLIQFLAWSALTADLPDCDNARFPTLFGSIGSNAMETINGVDIFEPFLTVVAVGHFTDKMLATDENG